MLKDILTKLATETSTPCVSISLNTHRTHPDNARDAIVLKNLIRDARERVLTEFGKREVANILQHLDAIPGEIDINHNLDSLHIFISEQTKEVVRSPWPTPEDIVRMDDTFAIRPLIKAYNRSEEYFILLLSQSGVHLYETLNDAVTGEVRNADFPIKENRHYLTDELKGSDPKAVDNMVREFLNRVDKAAVRAAQENSAQCVVICTDDNYSKLMQVADRPGVYLGYASINYNNTAPHHIAAQAWQIVLENQRARKSQAIGEVQAAVSQGKVLTDLQSIYQAAREGRGDLLIAHQDYAQPVRIAGEFTLELVDDPTTPGVIDDITSSIAWEVMSKKGRVVFVPQQDEMNSLGPIALKVRY